MRIVQNFLMLSALDILFRQITTFIKVQVAFVFGLHTSLITFFSKMWGNSVKVRIDRSQK